MPAATTVFRTILVSIAVTAFMACRNGPETTVLQIGDSRFTVWVASTPDQRQRGLMFRTDLGPRQGMLFVFEDSSEHEFWMKNTPLPLSIAFLTVDGVIFQIESLTPYSELVVRSRQPARYAIEVKAGAFSEVGANVGDKISFPRNWR